MYFLLETSPSTHQLFPNGIIQYFPVMDYGTEREILDIKIFDTLQEAAHYAQEEKLKKYKICTFIDSYPKAMRTKTSFLKFAIKKRPWYLALSLSWVVLTIEPIYNWIAEGKHMPVSVASIIVSMWVGSFLFIVLIDRERKRYHARIW